MVLTYTKRSTTTNSVATGDNGTDTVDTVAIQWDASGTSTAQSRTITNGTVMRRKFQTNPSVPNLVTWGDGTITWRYRITTANTDHYIVEVIIRRISSDGTVVRASVSSGTINIQLTTGVKSGTITHSNTLNPAGSVAGDRIEINYRISNTGTMATAHSAGTGLTTGNDENDYPFDATGVRTVTVNLSETITLTDAVDRSRTRQRSLGETLTITDAIDRRRTRLRDLAETLTITDQVDRRRSLIKNLGETFTLTDAVNRLRSITKSLNETLTLTDAVERRRTRLAQLQETLTLTDAVVRNIIASGIKIVNLSESMTISDGVNRSRTINRTLDETVTLTDAVGTQRSKIAQLSETLTITDNAVRSKTLNRNLDENITITDNVDSKRTIIKNLAETLTLTDAVNRVRLVLRSLGETITMSDAVNRYVPKFFYIKSIFFRSRK